jgi:hypothetical protein
LAIETDQLAKSNPIIAVIIAPADKYGAIFLPRQAANNLRETTLKREQ